MRNSMQITKKVAPFLLLLFATYSQIQSQCCTFPLYGKTFFLSRSQGTDAVRDLVGTHRFMHRYDTQGYHGAVSFTPQYMHSYKDDRLAEYFFGSDYLTISGSQVEARPADAIMADYFGLSPTFQSTIKIDPTVDNFVGDISWYSQWNRWYAQLHLPYVWTRWDCKLNEFRCDESNTPYPAHYMATEELAAPINSFAQAMRGGVTFGDVTKGMRNGLINCPLSENGLADVHLSLGYDFVLREHGNAGLYAHLVAPTGTKSNGHYLFEPVIGNGRHWEYGLGFNGRVLMWETDGNQSISFFFDGKVTHLGKSPTQCRSFDLRCNCFGNRYALLKVFENGAYTRTMVPAINVTTLPCTITIDAQLDLIATLNYTNRGFEVDFGYNAWIRTKEKITLCGEIPENRYGLKGIQDVVTETEDPSFMTQHTATLHGNFLSEENQQALADIPSPRYINTCDIDPESAATTSALTHKLFINFNYSWNTENENRFMPFLGIGSSIEFEGLYPDHTQPNKNTLSQYSIWLKGGIGF